MLGTFCDIADLSPVCVKNWFYHSRYGSNGHTAVVL